MTTRHRSIVMARWLSQVPCARAARLRRRRNVARRAGLPHAAPDEGPKIPEGFTPIFTGKDLSGWHVSKTNHHGTTPDYRVLHGLIVGTQNPRGKGGFSSRTGATRLRGLHRDQAGLGL